MTTNNKNLLIVAGAGRNVGKTEFVCRLIKKFCLRADIYALKVSAIYPDEGIYHGNHDENDRAGWLFEETRRDLNKDTSRMLSAGARRVFYLRADSNHVYDGYAEFLSRIPDDAVIVCESNSLREVVKPALMIMVWSKTGNLKPRAQALLFQCDIETNSDGKSGFPELEGIIFSKGNGWSLG